MIDSLMDRLRRLLYRTPPGLRRMVRFLPGSDRLRVLVAGKPQQSGPVSGTLRPVVYLPTWVRWDSMRQRPQYLLAAFARLGHPVYFVDQNETRMRQADGVNIVSNLGDVPSRDVILYVHFAPMRHLFASFDNAAVVYDILDDLTIYDADEHGLPEERRVRSHHPLVMEKAAVVLVSNEVLGQIHLPERGDLIHVPNGVDAAFFAERQIPPPDVRTDGRPIVGYHGMISHWFDFELLAEVARLRPGYRFVLVGPHDPRVEAQVRGLETSGNIEVLGERPSDQMPAYVQSFDVGTVWFQVTEMTMGVTPLKVYEYLAAGVGCVSTPLPACVAEPSVRTAGTGASFAEQLDLALAEKGSQSLVDAALRSDWMTVLQPAIDRLEELDLRHVP